MYGFHVERLEVFRRVNGQDGGAIFSISGAKGQVWRQARVGIASPGFNDQVLILTHHPVTSSLTPTHGFWYMCVLLCEKIRYVHHTKLIIRVYA